MSTKAPLLVTPQELSQLARSTDVAILDASWHMPNSPRNAQNEFAATRIPGARFFDLDQVASPNELGLKHMMPSPQIFSEALAKLGIRPSSHVVLYDSQGIFSSPRALFTFRALGHENSSVLNGGLPRWQTEGLPTDSGPLADVEKSTYPLPTLNDDAVRSYSQVVDNSAHDLSAQPIAELVLDARSRGRYTGEDPEPRPGLSSGHIPNSFSLPFNVFLAANTVPNSTAKYTTFLPPDELRKALVDAVGPEYAQQILEGKRKVISSCGSGMTAGVLWLGLKIISESTKVAIYDESWTGYASRAESKIDKGPK
ncbi:thiosulfate sulfurtransferase [Dentipellis sp. KUC8613]|nr:thiosulfate sulfurtransferase [Dentipellis sp. KUC8613]